MDQNRFRELVSTSLPQGFIPDTMRCLASAYDAAARYCLNEYPNAEAKSMQPIMRRANIERDVRKLASEKYGLSAEAAYNSIGNYAHSIIASDGLRITVSSVRSRNQLVRPAEFRGNYAREYQLDLFEEPRRGTASNGLAYAVLTHGPDPKDRRLLKFAFLSFPDEELTRWVEQIDLLKLCKELGEEPYTIVTEEVQSPPRIQLRPVAAKKLG